MKRAAITIIVVLAGLLPARFPAVAREVSRADKIRSRYMRILERRPADGVALRALVAGYEREQNIDALVKLYRKRIEEEPENETNRIVLGLIFIATGKPDEAIAPLEDAVEADRRNYYALKALGDALAAAGQSARAAASYEAAVRNAPNARARRETTRLLATAYGEAGEKDKAVAAWKKLARQAGDDPVALTEVARSLADAGFHDEATELYEKVISLSAEDPARRAATWRAMAALWSNREKYDQALAAYGRALKLLSADNYLRREIELELEDIYRRRGRLKELAVKAIEEAARAGSDSSAWRRAARLAIEAGMPDRAVEAFRKALETEPGSARLVREMTRMLGGEGRGADAVKILERLAARENPSPTVMLELAGSYARAGRVDDARKILHSMIASGSGDVVRRAAERAENLSLQEVAVEGWFKLSRAGKPEDRVRYGEVLFKAGRKLLARSEWVEAARAALDDPETLDRAAGNLMRMGEKALALELFKQAAAKRPEDVELAKRLARAADLAGKKILAREQWMKVFERTEPGPLNDEAQYALIALDSAAGKLDELQEALAIKVAGGTAREAELLLHVRILMRKKRTSEAVELLSGYVKSKGVAEAATLAGALADLYKADGRFAEAIRVLDELAAADAAHARRHLRKALECARAGKLFEREFHYARELIRRYPNDPVAYLEMARLWRRRGHPEKAEQTLKKAASVAPDNFLVIRELAELLSYRSDFAGARTLYLRVVRSSRDVRDVRDAVERLTALAALGGSLDALERTLAERIREEPSELEFYRLLARVYRATNKQRLIEPLLEKALRTSDREQVLLMLFEQLLAVGDAEGALKWGIRADAASAKRDVGLKMKLVGVALQAGKVETARSLLAAAVASSVQAATVLAQGLELFIAADRIPEAIKLLETFAARKGTRTPYVLHQLGVLNQRLGKWDAAVRWFEEVLAVVDAMGLDSADLLPPPVGRTATSTYMKRTPTSVVRRRMTGMPGTGTALTGSVAARANPELLRAASFRAIVEISVRQGRAKSLAARLWKKIDAAPNKRRPYDDLLVLLLAVDDAEGVWRLYQKVAKEFPRDLMWHRRLANLLEVRFRQPHRALEIYNNLARSPREKAIYFVVRERARLAIAVGDEKTLRDVLATNESNLELLLYIAGFHRKKGNLKAEEKLLRKILAVSERPARARRNLIRNLADQRRWDDAAAAFAQWLAGSKLVQFKRLSLASVLEAADREISVALGMLPQSARPKAWKLFRTKLGPTSDSVELAVLAVSAELSGLHDEAWPLLLKLARRTSQPAVISRAVKSIALSGENTEERLAELFVNVRNSAVIRQVAPAVLNRFKFAALPALVRSRLKRALSDPKAHTSDVMRLADAMVASRLDADAEPLLERVVREAPNSSVAVHAAEPLMAIYRKSSKEEKARRLLELMVASLLDRSRSQRTGDAVTALWQLAAPDRLADQLEEILARRAASASALPKDLLNLAAFYRLARMRGREVETLKRYLALWPSDTNAAEGYIDALVRAGFLFEAAAAGERALALGRFRSASILSKVVGIYDRLGLLRLKADLYMRSALASAHPEHFRRAAVHYAELGEREEAYSAFKRYLGGKLRSQASAGWKARQEEIAFLRRLGLYETALDKLKAYLPGARLDPAAESVRDALLYERNLCHVLAGSLDKLVASSREVLKRKGGDIETLRTLAWAFAAQGKPSAELEIRKRIKILKADDYDNTSRLADLYLRFDEPGKAVKLLARLVEEDRAHRKRHIEKLGRIYYEKGRRAEAENIWSRMAEDPAGVLRLAGIYAERGLYGRELELFSRALTQYPGEHRIYLGYVAAAVKAGAEEDALKVVLDGLDRFTRPYEKRDLIEALLADAGASSAERLLAALRSAAAGARKDYLMAIGEKLAASLASARRHRQACRVYDWLAETDPTNHGFLADSAYEAALGGFVGLCEERLRRLAGAGALGADTQVKAMRTAHLIGNDELVDAFLKMLNPDGAESTDLVAIGLALGQIDRYAQAARCFERAYKAGNRKKSLIKGQGGASSALLGLRAAAVGGGRAGRRRTDAFARKTRAKHRRTRLRRATGRAGASACRPRIARGRRSDVSPRCRAQPCGQDG